MYLILNRISNVCSIGTKGEFHVVSFISLFYTVNFSIKIIPDVEINCNGSCFFTYPGRKNVSSKVYDDPNIVYPYKNPTDPDDNPSNDVTDQNF